MKAKARKVPIVSEIDGTVDGYVTYNRDLAFTPAGELKCYDAHLSPVHGLTRRRDGTFIAIHPEGYAERISEYEALHLLAEFNARDLAHKLGVSDEDYDRTYEEMMEEVEE